MVALSHKGHKYNTIIFSYTFELDKICMHTCTTMQQALLCSIMLYFIMMQEERPQLISLKQLICTKIGSGIHTYVHALKCIPFFRVYLFNCESTDALDMTGPESKHKYQ